MIAESCDSSSSEQNLDPVYEKDQEASWQSDAHFPRFAISQSVLAI
jgi:hypothetical protein